MRPFRVLIFDSVEGTSLRIAGTGNFTCTGNLPADKFVQTVTDSLRHRNNQVSDSKFDVFAFDSNRWLNPKENIDKLPDQDTLLILVSQLAKQRFGEDGSFYLILAELDGKLREEGKQDLLPRLSKSLQELRRTLKELDGLAAQKINRIVTLNPDFMGIGVNSSEVVKSLKKLLRKK